MRQFSNDQIIQGLNQINSDQVHLQYQQPEQPQSVRVPNVNHASKQSSFERYSNNSQVSDFINTLLPDRSQNKDASPDRRTSQAMTTQKRRRGHMVKTQSQQLVTSPSLTLADNVMSQRQTPNMSYNLTPQADSQVVQNQFESPKAQNSRSMRHEIESRVLSNSNVKKPARPDMDFYQATRQNYEELKEHEELAQFQRIEDQIEQEESKQDESQFLSLSAIRNKQAGTHGKPEQTISSHGFSEYKTLNENRP